MNEQMECMCLDCGISLLLPREVISLDDDVGESAKLLRKLFCTECGGQLILIGAAGAEPHYRLE
jgi:DNA-directed RNA polymerase subunit RPC12/RpoP